MIGIASSASAPTYAAGLQMTVERVPHVLQAVFER
jgi:hypothetical protein